MPVTLESSKVGINEKVDQQVIETIRRNSIIMDALVFDNAVSAGTGGSTLTYGYLRLKNPATANGRAINQEYTPQEAEREKKTTDLVVMGGSFQIDRVIAESDGAIDEVEFQLNQKTKATIGRYQYLLINGKGSVATEFDGLNELLKGADTEFDASAIDVSTIDEESAAALVEALDGAIAEMDGKPTHIIANSKAITKIKAAARKLGYLTASEDAFGRSVEAYNNIPLVDMGKYNNGVANVDIVPVTEGATNIYLVRTALDGLHGVSLRGEKLVSTHVPDFTEAKAVHTGDVEFVASLALKNTRAAAVLKGVKI
jgi:hypothetical protein